MFRRFVILTAYLTISSLLVSPTSFAMQRKNSNTNGISYETALELARAAVITVIVYLNRQPLFLDESDPHCFQPEFITLYCASSGEMFDVPLANHELRILLIMAPGIAELIEQVRQNRGDVTFIHIDNVSRHSIYLLTQMARRQNVVEYLKKLTSAEVEGVIDDALKLRSKELEEGMLGYFRELMRGGKRRK